MVSIRDLTKHKKSIIYAKKYEIPEGTNCKKMLLILDNKLNNYFEIVYLFERMILFQFQ